MQKARLPKPPEGKAFALYLIEEGKEKSGEYDFYHLHAKLAVVELDSTDCHDYCQEGGVRYGGFSNIRRVDTWLRALQVYSQGNVRDEDRHLYGWHLEYRDIYSTDLASMEIGVSLLRQIEKRMEAEGRKLGCCTSYGQYVARFGRALRCKYVLVAPARGNWDSGYRYRTYPMSDCSWVVDRITQQWIDGRKKVVA